jgi:N-acetylglucosaminyldiphosphoundecaprenol N-acetyl-beta-D-mannosaminyltransferase
MIEHVVMGGVRIATASRDELAALVVDDSLARHGSDEPPRLLFDANGHGLSLAASDADFRHALEAADVVHADGGFLVSLSRRMAGAPIAERSATTDMIHDLAVAGARSGITHFLLGATEGVNARCVERLAQLYPQMEIVGRHHGFFDGEERKVIEAINRANPDVLWVGLGKPREQEFALANRNMLKARWIITCGGCFNYITGDYRRAPQWMQDKNLEWLFRAVTSPRLLWRYATTTPHALWLVFTRRNKRVLPEG